jgi:hypothetical protein
LTLESLFAARRLVAQTGGIERAKTALNALEVMGFHQPPWPPADDGGPRPGFHPPPPPPPEDDGSGPGANQPNEPPKSRLDSLVAAHKLAAQLGGIEHAKTALNDLQEFGFHPPPPPPPGEDVG